MMKALMTVAAVAVTFLPGVALCATLHPRVTEAATRDAMTNYVQAWSSDHGVDPQSMNRFYADHVVYYGKSMSRREVFRDKLNYIATWPQRRYWIVPNSTSVVCDGAGALCRVQGVMQWDRRSAAGARSTGAAQLTLTLSRESGGKIVRESASLRNRL